MPRTGYVYILASRHNGTLYVGVTSDLARRIWEHRHHGEGFTKRYRVSSLVHVEAFDDIWDAIAREKQLKRWRQKQLKRWRRAWKTDLIDQHNPTWHDLLPEPAGDASAADARPQDGSPPARG